MGDTIYDPEKLRIFVKIIIDRHPQCAFKHFFFFKFDDNQGKIYGAATGKSLTFKRFMDLKN